MAQERLLVLNRHLERCAPKDQKPLMSTCQDNSTLFAGEEFKYSLNNSILSRGDRTFYETNGYIIIPDLLDNEILHECCERFSDICAGRVPKGNSTLMKDVSLMKTGAKGEFLYNKVQDVLFDEVFEKYFLNKKLLDVVECFTGPNIMAIHSMFINKPPDSGVQTSRHPLHQDLYYFPIRPADRIVAAWTALEDCTPENGCLVVVPGSHKGPLIEHSSPQWQGGVNKLYHGVKGYSAEGVIPVPMRSGETIFFHPLLVHGSGPNTTQGFRRSISCHYAASDCHYIDVSGTIQEGLADEILDVARKRGFHDADFQMIWKSRSRLVRGEYINL